MERAARRRTTLTLAAKLEIIKELENGVRISVLARKHNMNESSIRRIRFASEKIKNSVACSTPLACKKLKKPRNSTIEKTEKLLSFWIEHRSQNRMPINTVGIRAKALEIFERLREEDPESAGIEFHASKGWFENFKRRQNLQKEKFTEEATSADPLSASLYPNSLKKIIGANGYSPYQVFNADETELFWKKMPSKTFLAKEEDVALGLKASKDRLTLLLCCNAAGDYKSKPLLVYRTENPRAFKEVSKTSLSVHWASSKNACMTAKIFENWFLKYFCVEAETYCRDKIIDFKVLLIVDNAPCHPLHLTDLHPNVKVIFLPPNTTSLIQPMRQGITAAFKLYYLKKILSDIVEFTDDVSIRAYWGQYNILSAIENIEFAWQEVKNSTMNSAWKKLWPEIFTGNVDVEMPKVDDIIALAKTVRGEGFEDLQSDDIREVFTNSAEDMTVDDILTLFDDDNKENDSDSDSHSDKSEHDVQIEEEKKEVTIRELRNILKLARQLEIKVLHSDPDKQRVFIFQANLTNALAPYASMYKDIPKTQDQHPSSSEYSSD